MSLAISPTSGIICDEIEMTISTSSRESGAETSNRTIANGELVVSAEDESQYWFNNGLYDMTAVYVSQVVGGYYITLLPCYYLALKIN